LTPTSKYMPSGMRPQPMERSWKTATGEYTLAPQPAGANRRPPVARNGPEGYGRKQGSCFTIVKDVDTRGWYPPHIFDGVRHPDCCRRVGPVAHATCPMSRRRVVRVSEEKRAAGSSGRF
jgi:hypothetical protein